MTGDYPIYGTILLYFIGGILYIAIDKMPYLGILCWLYGISNLIAYIFVRKE